MEIARVFLDVSMSLSFKGLTRIMSDAKMKPDAMPDKKFVVFINRRQTAFKVYINNSLLVYHNNGSRRFPLEAVSEFPNFFNGKSIDFSGAVRKAVERKFAK